MSIEEKYRNKIVDLISVLCPEAKIYLYGSFARGEGIKGSDIDIAVDAGKELKASKFLEIQAVLANVVIPYHLDVVDFWDISKDLRESIEKDKVIWKN